MLQIGRCIIGTVFLYGRVDKGDSHESGRLSNTDPFGGQLEEVSFARLGTMEEGTYGYYVIRGRETAPIHSVKRVRLVVVLERKEAHPVFGHGPLIADVQEENWAVLNQWRKEGKYKVPPPVYAVDADKFYIE